MQPRRPIPIVTTREYGPIVLPRGLDTSRTRERLEIAGRRAGLRTFEARGASLYALGIVGVIDIGNLVVEILPKSNEGASALDGAAFLARLLGYVGQSRRPTITEASISEHGGGLFELILSWAVDQVGQHVAIGLPRRYVPREELSSAIRGRIDLRHLALQRPGRNFELLVRHAPLSQDNLVARTIRWLLAEVARRTMSTRTRSRALALVNLLTPITSYIPQVHELERLNLTPLEAHWQPLITLAYTLLMQKSPDPARAGTLDSIAVLYSLPRLFEDAIRRVLSIGLGDWGFLPSVGTQPLLNGDGKSLITLKPDFRFCGTDGKSVVGDAKWKRIFQNADRIQLAEDDAYQITSYLAATDAARAFLISPIDMMGPSVMHREFRVRGLDRPLTLIGVHLPDLIADDDTGKVARTLLCRLVADGI